MILLNILKKKLFYFQLIDPKAGKSQGRSCGAENPNDYVSMSKYFLFVIKQVLIVISFDTFYIFLVNCYV